MSKRDKGKGIQNTDDTIRYPATFHEIQVPVQNKFNSLSNYPPLPYEAVVNGSFSKPHDRYHVKHTEHLFLINLNAPSLPSLRPIIQKSFGNFDYLSDNLVKTQDFYQLILIDSQFVTITHTRDEHNPNFIMFSKCIIRRVLTSRDWKEPFADRNFSKPNHPQSYNYNDYKMAWFRTFLFRPETHSCVFNFHDSCQTTFPVWFYHWWLWFDNTPAILPLEGKMGWDYWVSHTPNIEPYMKEAPFFRTFNVAWIFCWEYQFQHFLQPSFPLSVVRIYKVRWCNDFKIILCGKENVTHFLSTNTKIDTLFNLAQIEAPPKQPALAQPTPSKMETSSSTKRSSHSSGLTQRQKDLLEALNEEPVLRKVYLQKFMAEDHTSDHSDKAGSSASTTKSADELQDSQDPYEY